MKKTLKTILQNSIDEKKYIFKYPITTFKYYDNANFLIIDNINENDNENDNQIEERKNTVYKQRMKRLVQMILRQN